MLLNYKFRKVVARFIPAVAILAVSFLAYPKSAHAANFVHHHSDSCIGRVTKICTDHTITYSDGGYRLAYCYPCELHSNPHCSLYTEVCNRGLIAPIEYRSQICPTCNKEMYTGPAYSPKAHTYYEDGYVCGFEEGEAVGSVSLTKSTASWTNQDVTISASVSSLAAGFDGSGVTYDFGNGASGNSSYSVSANGTYSVVVSCPGYASVSESIVVSNIDKTAPKISLSKSTEKWTEAGVDVYVSASDDESGLADAAYSFNGGAYGTGSSIHLSSNGTVSVKVVDKAGNVATGTIAVSNIGKDPAVIEAERLEAERLEAERKEAERLEAERLEAIKKAEEEKKKQELLNSLNKTEGTTKPNKNDTSISKPGSNTVNGLLGSGSSNVEATPETETVTHKNPLGNLIASFTGANKTDSQEEKTEENDATPVKNLVSVSKKTSTRTDDTAKEKVTNDSTVSHYIKLDVNSQSVKDIANNKKDETNKSASLLTTEEKAIEYATKDFEANSNGSLYSYIIAGVMVLLLGLMLVSHFNYIYYRKDGKIKIAQAARAKTDGKRIIVTINDKKLSEGGKFFIYLSPWLKLSKKKKHVYVQVKNQDVLIGTDESLCFSY